ncbi:hypothetical protein POM88_029307 [Heracleum sosnowskyi]|uniref:Uncharacterized protein n=1 Tax=Heracleum sosnowskyi TaxID=360622 RepID=A0AAD8MHJ9_9APIA|nr:hypothetical protein POM88_029307 [Heracleum sosnowskyi]
MEFPAVWWRLPVYAEAYWGQGSWPLLTLGSGEWRSNLGFIQNQRFNFLPQLIRSVFSYWLPQSSRPWCFDNNKAQSSELLIQEVRDTMGLPICEKGRASTKTA